MAVALQDMDVSVPVEPPLASTVQHLAQSGYYAAQMAWEMSVAGAVEMAAGAIALVEGIPVGPSIPMYELVTAQTDIKHVRWQVAVAFPGESLETIDPIAYRVLTECASRKWSPRRVSVGRMPPTNCQALGFMVYVSEARGALPVYVTHRPALPALPAVARPAQLEPIHTLLAGAGFAGLEAFRAWLRAQHATDVVGYPNASLGCPLANWLSTITGGRIVVGFSGWALCGSGRVEEGPLPAWARAFVHQVDQVHPNRHGSPVLAMQALEYLTA